MNNGGPVYPLAKRLVWAPDAEITYSSEGITLLDYFAGQALAGWLASFAQDAEHPASAIMLEKHPHAVENIARFSYDLAKAMLDEREKRSAT